jgi:hypothetical protein
MACYGIHTMPIRRYLAAAGRDTRTAGLRTIAHDCICIAHLSIDSSRFKPKEDLAW